MQIEPWPDAYEAVKAICNSFVKSCRFKGFGQGRICPTTTDNLVPVVGETSRRNSTDVAQAECTNSHAPFLWLMPADNASADGRIPAAEPGLLFA